MSYKTRKVLKGVGIGLLVTVLVLAAAYGCYVTWLGRYVTYTREGAVIDRELPPIAEGVPMDTTPKETIEIFYNEGDDAVNTSTELTPIRGVYLEPGDLTKDKDLKSVKKSLQELEPGTAVMLDMKNIYGGFLYSSQVSENRSDQVDIDAMDQLVEYLNKNDFYTIARIPAFRDRDYGLNHVLDGLTDAEYDGGCLWSDDQGCYWLNPSREGTISYLADVILELRTLGFDEVVLTDFYVPMLDRVMYSGDRLKVLEEAAASLITTCATDRFALSFEGSGTWKLPEGRTRLYVSGVEPAQVDEKAQSLGTADPTIHVVFRTDLHDTRFDDYSVLRPLAVAHR